MILIKQKNIFYDIEFYGDCNITNDKDCLMAADETDVSILSHEVEDFVHKVKCFTQEKIQMLKNTKKPSPFQKKWKILHD